MKVLFFHIPNLGMYQAIEPILLELQERRHKVIHYNEAGFRCHLREGPIEFAPYERYEGYVPRALRSAMNVYELGLLLLETAEHTVEFVEAAIRRERPDLVLHSKFAVAAKIGAARCGVPAGCLTTGFVFYPHMVQKSGQRGVAPAEFSNVAALLRFRTRANRFYGRRLNGSAELDDIFVNDEPLHLVLALEAFQPARARLPPHCTFIGPTVQVDCSPKSYELLYASLGSVFVDNRRFFQICIEVFGMLGMPAVISLGGGLSAEDFKDVPDHVELRRFVAQKDVLRRAALFVTHGGGVSVAEAISSGTPMVVVPQIPEQLLHARQIEGMMLGRHVNPSDLTAALLYSTVTEVLQDHRYRNNVQALRGSLPLVAPAITACKLIEEFASKGSGL